jgi:hypothetical protein
MDFVIEHSGDGKRGPQWWNVRLGWRRGKRDATRFASVKDADRERDRSSLSPSATQIVQDD